MVIVSKGDQCRMRDEPRHANSIAKLSLRDRRENSVLFGQAFRTAGMSIPYERDFEVNFRRHPGQCAQRIRYPLFLRERRADEYSKRLSWLPHSRAKRKVFEPHAKVMDANFLRRTSKSSNARGHVRSFAQKKICLPEQFGESLTPERLIREIAHVVAVECGDMPAARRPRRTDTLPSHIPKMRVHHLCVH